MSSPGITQQYSYTQYPRLEKMDISKGLSQNVILDMHMDKEGFLWLGTMDGLNKYDGYQFDIFKKQFKLDSTYVNNFIHRVWTDHHLNAWVIKEDGAYIIDHKSNKTEKITINGEMPSRFYNLKNDSLWVVTRTQNVYKVHIDNKGFKIVSPEIRKYIVDNQDWILNIEYATEDEFLISTTKGSVIHYKDNQTSYNKIENINEKIFSGSAIDNKGHLWLSSFDGLIYEYDINNKVFERIDQNLLGKEPKLQINCLYFDALLNCIWISTQRKGLFKYDLELKQLGRFIIRAPGANILDSENILTLLRDPYNEILYLGSDQHGMLVWDPYLYKFDFINPNRSSTSKLGFRLPRKLEKDNFGNVWIGSVNTGLWRYNRANDKLDVFTKESNPDLLSFNSSVQLLHENDTLWVGHNGGGITKLLLPHLKKINHFTVKGEEKELDNKNVIWNLIKDSKDRLWIGTRSSGIYIKKGNSIKTINSYNSILQDNTIYSIVEDQEKNIIICSQKSGLYKFNIETEKITRAFPKPDDKQKYSSKSVLFDKNGMIWYATDGKGLLLLDHDYNIVAKADSDNSLLQNDAICSLILNDDNTLWASTNYGLYKLSYDETTYNIHSEIYTERDGLTSNEFMTGAYLKTQDTLWMGNMEGVNYFIPEKIVKNPYAPRVYIKNVQINNRVTTNLNALNSLKNSEDNLAFEYNTIGHTVPSKTFYSYRLIGYDSIWSSPNTRTFSRYTNLKPGHYQFQVKACNYDGVWNNDPDVLSFTITPLLWQTVGFQVFLVMMSLLVGMLFYTYRINLVKKEQKLKNKYLKEITQMEMRALRAQINPHFLFNTLNSINSYILQEDGKAASHYLVKFSKLMRMILRNSTNSFITLEDEIHALEIYIELEGMRFGNSFDFFLNIDKNIELSKILIPPMLLQPFVENAIWHGLMHKDGEKVLAIDIKPNGRDLINISIKDNGIGRDAALKLKESKDKRKSFGMDITKKRIQLINKEYVLDQKVQSSIDITDLANDNDKATGTEVIVKIPRSLQVNILATTN